MVTEFYIPSELLTGYESLSHRYGYHENQDQSDYEVLELDESSFNSFYPMLSDMRTPDQKYDQFVNKLMKKSNDNFILEMTEIDSTNYEYVCRLFKTMFFEKLFTRCLELKIFETDINHGKINERRNRYLEYIIKNEKCPDEFIMECLKVPILCHMMMDMGSFYSCRYHCRSKCSYYTEKVKQKLVVLGYAIVGCLKRTKPEAKCGVETDPKHGWYSIPNILPRKND
jgi:hypothetical protein